MVLLLQGMLTATGGAARADAVSDWLELTESLVESARPSERAAGEARVRTQVALAMVEAANALDRRYVSHLRFPTVEAGGAIPAALATAAYTVLITRLPAHAEKIKAAYTIGLASAPDGTAKERGRAVGEQAAQAALRAGGKVSTMDPQPYRPRTAPGVWVPTDLPVIHPVSLTVRPWVLSTPADLRPGPPPTLQSARWARDYDEVKRQGGKGSSTRSDLDTMLARFWADVDVTQIVRHLAEGSRRSPLQNARLYALLYMTLDDTILAGGEAKLHYNAWRPLTAIRNGQDDGNPDTQGEASWEPLLATPNHPEYPCAHCATAAALGAVLSSEFGPRPPGQIRVSNRQLPGVIQVLPSFSDFVAATSRSRIMGGVHFRFAADAGESLGRAIGELAVKKLFPPVARAQTSAAPRSARTAAAKDP